MLPKVAEMIHLLPELRSQVHCFGLAEVALLIFEAVLYRSVEEPHVEDVPRTLRLEHLSSVAADAPFLLGLRSYADQRYGHPLKWWLTNFRW